MAFQDAIRRVLVDYQAATTQPFKGHPLADFIRGDLEDSLTTLISVDRTGILIEGSPGKGRWATTPWLSVFDDGVTTTATDGYYLVYLFNPYEGRVALSFNQGTTAVRREFGPTTRDVLKDRAAFIRHRLGDFASRFSTTTISLGSKQDLPLDYEAGHAFGVEYTLDTLPGEERLRRDADGMIAAMRALTFRGGLNSDEAEPPPASLDKPDQPPSLLERRQYREHLRIERNSKAAKAAKAFHGVTCQACGLNFETLYGSLGAGYIEAHHLKPLSSLREGEARAYDVAGDFAVLCANCHRMIHRSDDPSDVKSLRRLVVTQVRARRALKVS